MPFAPVNVQNGGGGNFPQAQQTLFNACGAAHYMGSIRFQNVAHANRTVPIFNDECLEGHPQTYALLRSLRKIMKTSLNMATFLDSVELSAMRSIHQNQNGYLPWSTDSVGAHMSHGSSSSGMLAAAASTLAPLPNNQAGQGAVTHGTYLEYTCGDNMHVEARLIVDYRWGIMYMTFGHYHADSFAMLSRSVAEREFEIKPVLPHLQATFIP